MDEFGTEPRMIRRNDGPDTSEAAAHSVDTEQFERLAYAIILEHGIDGCTLDQLREGFLRRAPPHTQFVNRRTGLHQKGMVLVIPMTRRGEGSGKSQYVYVAKRLLLPEWIADLKQNHGWLNPCLFGPNEEVPLDPSSKKAIIRDLANDLAATRLALIEEGGLRSTSIGEPLDTEDSALGRACALFKKSVPLVPDWDHELDRI
jgi:hypothetical protein